MNAAPHVALLRDIPTDVIAGSDRNAQERILSEWLAGKPDGEHWAVLTASNWLDTRPAPAGVTMRGLPPGCACCIGNVSFRVVLTRLLRAARPDRVVIVLAPGDHVEQTVAVLRGETFERVLRLEKIA